MRGTPQKSEAHHRDVISQPRPPFLPPSLPLALTTREFLHHEMRGTSPSNARDIVATSCRSHHSPRYRPRCRSRCRSCCRLFGLLLLLCLHEVVLAFLQRFRLKLLLELQHHLWLPLVCRAERLGKKEREKLFWASVSVLVWNQFWNRFCFDLLVGSRFGLFSVRSASFTFGFVLRSCKQASKQSANQFINRSTNYQATNQLQPTIAPHHASRFSEQRNAGQHNKTRIVLRYSITQHTLRPGTT